MFDELARRLLGYLEVQRHVGGGGIAIADPDECEAVSGSHVNEASAGETFLDAFDQLAAQAQDASGCLPALYRHENRLTYWSSSLTMSRQVSCLLMGGVMPFYREAEASPFERHGSRFLSYVAPARGSSQLCAWRLEIPAGLQGVAHRPTREEVLLVLDGELQVTLDGLSTELHSGDVALVPADSELRIDAGPAGATAWVTTTPGLQAVLADGSRISPPWAM